MIDARKFYIDGEWVDPISTTEFPIINPATEEKIGVTILGVNEDVENAVAAAEKAFESFSKSSKDERLSYLEKLLSVTRERFDDLAWAMTQEMGAPISMSRSLQADAGVGHLEGFIDALKELSDRETLKNGDILVREAIGVCGLITPWNWPINQIVLKVVPALATGCTCILKPSEHTPISAKIYAEIIHEVGYPRGVFNLVQGDGATVGSAMSCHKAIQMISFTGSTRAGSDVSKKSSDTVKRVTLELGGKSPNIIFADCDLKERVKSSVIECFLNTGQSCDAPTRMLVEKKCYGEVLDLVKEAVLSQKVGDPTIDGDHIGPLFDKIQFDRVQKLIKDGIEEGAKLLIGGLGRPKGFTKGWYVRPTVFVDVSNDMRIAQEEIFGPVLVVIPFNDEEQAISFANDTPYGLAAYLQTNDLNRAERVSSKLKAGAIHINGGGFNYGSPFGGFKQSGNGREGGKMGLEDFQEVKTLHYGKTA